MIKQQPIEGAEYYQISLFANEKGEFEHTIYTHFVGWHDINRRIELRQPSLLDAKWMIENFASIEEPALIINTDLDAYLFLFYTGGHGLLEKSIAEKYLKDIIDPRKSVFMPSKGLTDISDVPQALFNRSASPKARMQIFDRDKRRCKICGASPANNEHVELHLHHIIPYSEGGLTYDANLITLCHTCHKGLHPHTDYSLFDAINVKYHPTILSTSKYLERIKTNIQFGIDNNKKNKKS